MPIVRSKKKRRKHNDCSRCTRQGEAFRCFHRRYKFDVDLAREIVADGRPWMELDPDDIRYSVDRCEINEGHLAHVNPEYPGIVAHLFFPDDDGSLVHAHRLIDGHHRATVCLRQEMPFYVYILTEEESVRILMRAPDGAIPAEYVGRATLQSTAAAAS